MIRCEFTGPRWAISTAIVSCLLVALAITPARSQQATGNAERDRQYEQLAQEASWMEQKGNLLKKVIRVVTPTVVHIEAAKGSSEEIRMSRHPVEEAGSGVVIGRGGKFYVLTNRHVIRDSRLSQIKIKFADGRILYPVKVWSDRGTDVAVMELAGNGLVAARLGNSDDLEIGEFVVAFGSPFGLNHSVTFGIISAMGRRDLKLGDGSVKYQNFLQTDAAINPGNSGGPLLNLRGEVVGINTAIASSSGGSEGIGFAIPVKMAFNIAKQLIDRGSVKRAYLGVRLDARFDAQQAAALGLPRPSGALVSAVTPKSPAAAANFQVGDVVTSIGSTSVEDDAHLVNLVSLTPVGETVDVLLYREGKPIRLKVTVGDRDSFESE